MSVNLNGNKGDTCGSDVKLNDSDGDTSDSAYETPVKTGRDSGDNSVITSNIQTKKRDFVKVRCLMLPI